MKISKSVFIFIGSLILIFIGTAGLMRNFDLSEEISILIPTIVVIILIIAVLVLHFCQEKIYNWRINRIKKEEKRLSDAKR